MLFHKSESQNPHIKLSETIFYVIKVPAKVILTQGFFPEKTKQNKTENIIPQQKSEDSVPIPVLSPGLQCKDMPTTRLDFYSSSCSFKQWTTCDSLPKRANISLILCHLFQEEKQVPGSQSRAARVSVDGRHCRFLF